MSKAIISLPRIAHSIYFLRGQKVMLDFDLAALYGVATKVLNQAVKRNRERFPEDFMFQLTAEEVDSNRSQFVTGSFKHREAKSRPYAFTEQGVAMLSSILKSERAVNVNIAIMRAFVKLRETLENNRELARKFAELEKQKIDAILEAIRQMMAPSTKPRREIGFHVREKAPRYRARNKR